MVLSLVHRTEEKMPQMIEHIDAIARRKGRDVLYVAFLETPDGKMKIEGAEFRYWPLEVAMKNKHHDEPGYMGQSVGKVLGRRRFTMKASLGNESVSC
jgi:hypothetical protein